MERTRDKIRSDIIRREILSIRPAKKDERQQFIDMVKKIRILKPELDKQGINYTIDDEVLNELSKIDVYEQFSKKLDNLELILYGQEGAYDIKHKYNCDINGLKKMFNELHDLGLITLIQMQSVLDCLDSAEIEYRRLLKMKDEAYEIVKDYLK